MKRQLVGTGLCVLVASCSSIPATGPPAPGAAASGNEPTASAQGSVAEVPPASRAPTASESVQPDGLQAPDILPPLARDRLALVVTDDLVVRSLPEISASSTIHPVYLQEGTELFVIDGPAYSDGFAWYQVTPLGPRFGDDIAPEDPLPRIGWVASGEPTDPWLLPWAGDCPSAELEAMWTERSLVMLACFGDTELVLEGMRTRCSYSVPGYITPVWLNHEWCELIPFEAPSDAFALGPVALEFHQPTNEPIISETETPMRIRGHFDDPAADTCREESLPGMEATPPELVVLNCRSRFVATATTELNR